MQERSVVSQRLHVTRREQSRTSNAVIAKAPKSTCSTRSIISTDPDRRSLASVAFHRDHAVKELSEVFRKRINLAGGNPLAIFPAPTCTHQDNGLNRADMRTGITKSIYKDCQAVLEDKLDYLFVMVMQSVELCAYCGAGLSTNAGISDYATNGTETHNFRPAFDPHIEWLKDLPPATGHKMLSALERFGKVQQVVNQNHDALLQKAGFPLEKINEIHGSWFDQRNPVVAMGGTMRSDLWNRLELWAERSDVVLALGTSLSGLSADMIPEDCAERNKDQESQIIDYFKGLVIVNYQRTRLDADATLRIYADVDDVMSGLIKRLCIEELVPTPDEVSKLSRRILRFREYALYYANHENNVKYETKAQIAARAQP